ncbi:TVP38/TMEM64 family protein [Halosimplex aquaticum]|uniref:TVP38/TMEM64 family protein n=1 Tax=Halosimplex aquaticum TaxID=3026162 RepID=A0ABD5XW17_9EURY|nr:TVP38/TMEM64 family protein [Halosimplex aquaticum]
MAAAGSDDTDDSADDADDQSTARVFRSPAARRDALVRGLALAGVLAGATVSVLALFPQVTDPIWVRAQVSALGPLAPAAFVGLQTAQVVLAPLPGQVIGASAGYAFGTVAGTVYSMVGVLLGTAIAFTASRRYGRPYVERVVDPAALARWDGFVDRRGAAGLFVLFLLPVFPDDLLCFVAGLSELRLRTVLALVAVGRTPSFLVAAFAGERLADGELVVFAAVSAAVVVGSLAVYVGRKRVLDRLDGAV